MSPLQHWARARREGEKAHRLTMKGPWSASRWKSSVAVRHVARSGATSCFPPHVASARGGESEKGSRAARGVVVWKQSARLAKAAGRQARRRLTVGPPSGALGAGALGGAQRQQPLQPQADKVAGAGVLLLLLLLLPLPLLLRLPLLLGLGGLLRLHGARAQPAMERHGHDAGVLHRRCGWEHSQFGST